MPPFHTEDLTGGGGGGGGGGAGSGKKTSKGDVGEEDEEEGEEGDEDGDSKENGVLRSKKKLTTKSDNFVHGRYISHTNTSRIYAYICLLFTHTHTFLPHFVFRTCHHSLQGEAQQCTTS